MRKSNYQLSIMKVKLLWYLGEKRKFTRDLRCWRKLYIGEIIIGSGKKWVSLVEKKREENILV